MPISDIYNFTEKRFSTFNHSMRIYIAGSEVSKWLSGSVSITYAGRDGYNLASFDLQNPQKVWQVTRENLKGAGNNVGNFRSTSDFNDESVKRDIFNAKQKTESNAYYKLDTTQSVLGQTKTEKVDFSSNGSISSNDAFYKNPYYPPDTYEERKYRLAVNDCIFNKHDWVRIFKKNPFSVKGDEWVEIFCGFIQEHPITTDFITGSSAVRISCSCIKQQLAKMRVQTNIHISDTDPQPILDKGFYADFINTSLLTHPFANQNLQDSITNLILGSTINKTVDESSLEELKRRVGYFSLGNVICYDPQSPGNTLERWHLMTVFGVNKIPFPQGGGVDDLWLTAKDMDILGQATSPSNKKYSKTVGGPTARYLHFLMPASGVGPGNLTSYDMMSGSGSEARDWTTRWECIRDLASKLDFQVLTSPSGDILIEFPQYGFTPCAYLTNFGNTPSNVSSSVKSAADEAKKSLSNPLTGSSKPKSNQKAFPQCDKTENSIANLFTFDLHQKEETLNDEAEDFPTVLQVGGGFAFNVLNDATNGAIETFSPRAYVYSPALVDRYGVVTGQVDFPFAGQKAEEIQQNGSNTSITQRLAQLGLIEFTKRMADASMWSGSVIYRPFLFPNRPIHLKKSARIGLLQSVTYNWTVAQSAGVTLSCNMIMAERHDGSYRLLTGAVNTPIDYGAVWGTPESTAGNLNKLSGTGKDKAVPQAANSGVYVETGSAKDAKKDVQTKQSTPDPKKYLQTLGKNLDMLYPPFRKMVEELYAACVAKNIPLTITSTYRTPEEQEEIRKYNIAHGLPAAEKFKSYHNYGCAVDFNIAVAGRNINHPAYASINNENVISTYSNGYTLFWGGKFKRTPDGIHFQIPFEWKMSEERAKQIADLYRKNNLSETECVKKVWACLNALNPDLVKNEVSPADQNILEEVTKALGNRYFTSVAGPYTAAHLGEFIPPKPCEKVVLKTAGLKRKSI